MVNTRADEYFLSIGYSLKVDTRAFGNNKSHLLYLGRQISQSIDPELT